MAYLPNYVLLKKFLNNLNLFNIRQIETQCISKEKIYKNLLKHTIRPLTNESYNQRNH